MNIDTAREGRTLTARRALLGLLPALLLPGCASSDQRHAWPATVVGVDRMRLLVPMRVRVRQPRGEETPRGTVVLRLHVDEAGAVQRVSVFESSGNANLDQAAVQAAQVARFAPYRAAGVPTAVTAMAPLHFP